MTITTLFISMAIVFAIFSIVSESRKGVNHKAENKAASWDAALHFLAQVDPNQPFYLNEVIHSEEKSGRRLVVWADGTREVFND